MNELISFGAADLLLTLVRFQSTLSLTCMGVWLLLLVVEVVDVLLLVPLLLLLGVLLLLVGVESLIVGSSGVVMLLLGWVRGWVNQWSR